MIPAETALRVVVVEDEPDDLKLIHHALTRGGLTCHVTPVDTREDFLREVTGTPPDIILSDHGVPSFNGFAALALAREHCPDTPFIFVSGSQDPSEVREARRRGASEWVTKSQLAALVPAVQEALRHAGERTQSRRAPRSLDAGGDTADRLDGFFADEAVFALDVHGRIVSWSRGAEALLGWPADEIVGRPFATCYRAEERALGKPQLDLQDAVARGRHEAEGWRVRRDGEPCWMHAVLVAQRDAAGRARGFVQALRDLTGQRRNETALRQAEAHYRRIVESCPVALLVADEERITLANEAAHRLFSAVAPGGLGGRALAEFFAAQVCETWTGRAPAGTQVLATELRRANGTVVRAEVAAARLDADGEPARVLALRDLTAQEIAHDLEAQVLAAEVLRANRTRQDAILRAAPDAIISVTAAGTVRDWNPAAESLFGRDCDQAIGRQVGELIGATGLTVAELAELARHFQSHADAASRRRDEVLLHRASGEKILAELFVAQQGAGPNASFILFLREIGPGGARVGSPPSPAPRDCPERVPLSNPAQIFIDPPDAGRPVEPAHNGHAAGRSRPPTDAGSRSGLLRRAQHANQVTAEARRSIGAIISQTRTPWGDVGLLSRSQVEELERVMRLLEIRLDERDKALAAAEEKIVHRDRNLAQTEALLRAREQLLAAMQAQETEPPPSSFSAEEIVALKQLKHELERQTASLAEAKTALKEREDFVERSETALLEKMQHQQEQAIELEQREEDLKAALRRTGLQPPSPAPEEPTSTEA